VKPLNELTHLQTIRRFKSLAQVALAAYGLRDVRLEFLTVAGNTLFRVFEFAPEPARAEDYPFKEGQYLLRIHDRGEQATDAIRLEMEWLSAIRRDLELAVPEPVPALDGSLLIQVSTPGIREKRDCTLLRWLKGRRVTKSIRPYHFQAQGEAMARLHSHAAKWSAPTGLSKRRFDYDGLFNDDVGAGLPNSAAWLLLPHRYRQTFEVVSRKVKQVMDDWGTDPDIYGLIHGDCGVDANVLFWKGQAHIIDFDGSGFGYYLYDLALALEHCWEDKAYPQYLDALLTGYTQIRSLEPEQFKHMDLFRAAFYVSMGLWTVAMDETYPNSPRKLYRHKRWLEYGLRFLKTHIEGC
jgi:Ser/Thr protein kinase RdoA (MazF antagonist)